MLLHEYLIKKAFAECDKIPFLIMLSFRRCMFLGCHICRFSHILHLFLSNHPRVVQNTGSRVDLPAQTQGPRVEVHPVARNSTTVLRAIRPTPITVPSLGRRWDDDVECHDCTPGRNGVDLGGPCHRAIPIHPGECYRPRGPITVSDESAETWEAQKMDQDKS